MLLFICLMLVVVLLLMIFSFYFTFKNRRNINGKHVLITGGSSGIGLSMAAEALKDGANITILARNGKKLKKAEEELRGVAAKMPAETKGKIQTFSVDVGGSKKLIAEAVQSAEANFGPIYMCICCAGFAKSEKFEDLSEDSVKDMMNVNFLGSFFVTQEAVKRMKIKGEGGIILLVSSQAGLFGLFGFTAYAASKGALIKFAEALHMEMKPFNISVTVGCPPDTDTPGLEEENKSKPIETKKISEASGLYQPDQVAQGFFNDALNGKFHSSVGFEGFMLATMCSGMSPITNCLSFACEVLLTGLFRFISVFYLWSFSKIVEKEHQKRLSSKKVE